ncbi:MAG: hypothetical protein P1P81_11490, partial [Desulfobulbales bacterium]|nr:hypothetical protein [Desulfobulbales bacterium]
EIGNADPFALLLREVMTRRSFHEYTTVVNGPVNTENFPVLERTAEYGRFLRSPVTVFEGYDSRINPDGEDLLIHDYFSMVGLEADRVKRAIESMPPGESDKLRNSLIFLLMDELRPTAALASEMLRYIEDPELRETITHPSYRLAPAGLTVDEAFNMLKGELLLWNLAASQLWTPRPERLQELYDRVVAGVRREGAARLALDVAVGLAQGNGCKAALPFLRIAEEKGGVALDMMEPIDVISSFYCEAKEGDPQKALAWWDLIGQNNIPVPDSLRADKALLDIKLGGQPPPLVYGR